jgi:hypothetical protein
VHPRSASVGLALLVVAALCSGEPPPVGMAEARRQVAALVPRGQRLVTAQGLPELLLHDLDGDAQPEVFALTVDLANGSDSAVEELSRYGRLFETEGMETQFRLLVLANRQGTLSLARVVDLGRWRVLATMDSHRISRDSPAPFALRYVFQTVEGAEHVWIAVFADLRLEPARAVFRETVSSEVSSLDLDADGVLDIVTAEREMERTGRSETYLTWYRWSGREFREHASTVIVRTLTRFLADTRAQLLGREYDALVRDALEPGAVVRFRRAGLPPPQIIAQYFSSAPELDSIRDVILPEIRENPFRVPSEAPPSVALDIRIVDTSGASHFVQIVVAIARNPFVRRPFTLLPTEGRR